MAEHNRQTSRAYGWLVASFTAAVVTVILALATMRAPASHDVSSLPRQGVTSAEAAALVAQGQPGPTVQASTPGVAVAPQLPANVEAGRAEIPWAQVGSGWTLTIFAAATRQVGGQIFPSGDQVLYLVNSVGGRYRIATLPALAAGKESKQNTAGQRSGSANAGAEKARWFLLAWSPNSRRAIVGKESFVGPGPHYSASEWDLVNGVALSPIGSLAPDSATYAADGKSIFSSGVAAPSQWGLDGRNVAPLQAGAADVGVFDGRVLPLPDGSGVLVGAQRGMVLLSSNGQIKRSYPAPRDYQHCDPIRWWRRDVVVMTCEPVASTGADVWAVPLAGAPSMLTGGDTSGVGYVDAWQTPHGTLFMTQPACGTRGQLHSLDEDGQAVVVQLSLPPGVTGVPGVVAVQPDQVTLITTGCDSVSRTLLRYTMATGATAPLLGPGLNGGTVVSVLGNPADA